MKNRCKNTARLWHDRRWAEPVRDRPHILQPPRKGNYGIAAYILGYVVLFVIIAGTFGAIAAILAGR